MTCRLSATFIWLLYRRLKTAKLISPPLYFATSSDVGASRGNHKSK